MTNLTENGLLQKSGCYRLAGEIIRNQWGWCYDNCKVRPELFQRQSLATVLVEFSGRATEAQVKIAWPEAVRLTHGASVDDLVNVTLAGYTINCFREALDRELLGG